MSTVLKQKVPRPWNSHPWCFCFLVLILGGRKTGTFSHCVLRRYVEVSWLSPAAGPAPGRSCLRDFCLGCCLFFFIIPRLTAQLATDRERLPCLVLGEGSRVSLYHLLVLTPQRRLGLCVGNPSLSVERCPGTSGAPGVHAARLSPCCNVMLRWLVSFLPHTASFIFLHHGAKAAWSQAPVLGSLSPRLRVLQQHALAIAHICFKKETVFSSTGHSSGRDGAIRNSSNAQQTGDVTVMISLKSTFTSGTGFQSKKPSQNLVCMENPPGRHPHLICMPNYPTHQLCCLLVHPDRRHVCASPCNSSAGAWGRSECWLAGTELDLDFSGGWTLPRCACWAKPAGTSTWWAQAGHQPALALPGACSILTCFFFLMLLWCSCTNPSSGKNLWSDPPVIKA